MKRLATALGFTVLCFASAAFAQDALVGRYVGSFDFQTNLGMQKVGVTVVIDSVEDGKVKGTATLAGRGCGGDYPFEGIVKGDSIGLRGLTKGGRAGDCSFGFKGKVEGNKLVGTYGRYELELRK